MRLLWRIEHGLQRKSKQMDAALGITGPQRLVLKIADQFPGLSAGELAHIVRLHPSTITGVLQRLVDKGLLARTYDAGDRRRVRLQVKPGGRRFTRQSGGTIEAAVAGVLARSSPTKVKGARELLGAVAEALEE